MPSKLNRRVGPIVDEGLSWEVMLPTKHSHMGMCKPKGSVRMAISEGGAEFVSVPASAARLLARKKKSGEVTCESRDDLLQAIDRVTAIAARQKVSQLIMRRDYAEKEMFDKLLLDGFSKDVAQDAVAYAVDIGLISNRRFADAFIRGKISAGWGMERIVKELHRRGVDARTLDGWPYDYLDPEDEYNRAVTVGSSKHVKEPNAYPKLVRFLMGRGFSYNVATSAAHDLLECR